MRSDLLERLEQLLEDQDAAIGEMRDEVAAVDERIARLQAERDHFKRALIAEQNRGPISFDLTNAVKNERLQAMVDAAREWCEFRRGRRPRKNGSAIADALEAAVRALGGEVKP